MKTDCGQRHFQGALDVEYKIVNSANDVR